MTKLRYFTLDEFNCSHTGENKMVPEFLELLDSLRQECGFPFIITSGYRSPSHPIEATKVSPGTHSQGIAADIKITSSQQRFKVLEKAFEFGFRGIGIAKDFIHLDIRNTPVVWTY
jgi:uncharacterized protein YcbK (DUF882 family)